MELFDSEHALVRIDMSEYMEKHTVSRLVGAPPGYVGYEEGGQLTEAVRRKPYSVILLDEIEKAHHDVFNILLQVLDDGRLTDNRGRTVSFSNTVIIMTGNVGSDLLAEQMSEGAEIKIPESVREQIMERLKVHFRPEFLNRLDEVVLFNMLNKAQISAIVGIQLEDLRGRMKEQELELTVDDAAIELLAERGYDPVYGARPVKRALQRELETPLARKLVAGEYLPGATVSVTAVDGKLSFS